MLGKMELANVWLACLVLHTMQVFLVMGVQKFEQQPSYTEVNPGQDALLLCKVFHKRGFCSWQKDNKPVGMYMHKYEWSGTQETGDCSLWIRAAQLEFDDGTWECQVTASDFHTQDALTSAPVKLVVRVPPQRPRIEYNASQVLPGHNLTSLHGEVAVIKCISHYGNPPPVLKWFLDQNEITPTRRQTNSTELDNPRTWLAISILELTISKENHGRTLRCVAVHESYSTKSSSIEVRLDVMFPPETRLIGIPTNDIEELRDSVAIRCVTAANPRAIVLWKREGQTQPASMQELLQFSPVVRQHAGLYTCQAKNKAGESSPIRMHIDVKYAPKILSIGPDRLTTAALFTSATFECVAEGNPQPTYQWLQRLPTPSDVIVERGREAKLHISNVTYDFQGEYVCKVTNIISGTERTVQSEAVALQVVGAPQVLRHSATPEVIVEQGQDAQMSLVVCADPRPRVVAWEWGSLRLEAGSEMGRYRVDEVLQEDREDCYLATLRIREAESTDSRAYYLAVENDRGTDRHAIRLYVNEPLQMSTLVSLAGAVLASFILLVCAFIYAIRTEKCCFARKGDFKPTDLDSQKLDIEKTATTGPGGIPADAIYTTAPRTGAVTAGRSPEAMKLPSIPTTTTTNNHHLNNTMTSHPFNHNYPHQQQQKSYVMETTPMPAFRPLSNRYQPPPTAQPRQQVSNYHPPQSPPPNFYESDNTDDPELLQMTYPNPPDTTYRSFIKYQPAPDNTRYDPNVLSNNTANSRSLPGSKRCYNSNKSKHRDRDRERRRPLQADNERYYDHIFPTYKTAGSDITSGGVTSFKRHQGGRNSYNSVYYQPESYRDHAEL